MELQLFVIWHSAGAQADTIISEISQSFEIIQIEHILWDLDAFSENISRFYGEKLPDRSSKIEECGTGRFTLVIVADHSPAYEVRTTSKGDAIVNTRMFDLKSRFRKMTGGGHKIHGTNSVDETRHDVLLLTHKPYDHFIQLSKGANTFECPQAITAERNLLGYNQWNSLQELFATLNETLPYVVMRNYDSMPDNFFNTDHEDVDILVADPIAAKYILNATKLSRMPYRCNYLVKIANRAIRFDIRYVGDGYYDTLWQKRILESRTLFKGFYVPEFENFRFMLLYHALIHKRVLATDYRIRLADLGFQTAGTSLQVLRDYLQTHGYAFTTPTDLSVYFNSSILDQRLPFRRYIYEILRTTYKSGSRTIAIVKKKLKNEIRQRMHR